MSRYLKDSHKNEEAESVVSGSSGGPGREVSLPQRAAHPTPANLSAIPQFVQDGP